LRRRRRANAELLFAWTMRLDGGKRILRKGSLHDRASCHNEQGSGSKNTPAHASISFRSGVALGEPVPGQGTHICLPARSHVAKEPEDVVRELDWHNSTARTRSQTKPLWRALEMCLYEKRGRFVSCHCESRGTGRRSMCFPLIPRPKQSAPMGEPQIASCPRVLGPRNDG